MAQTEDPLSPQLHESDDGIEEGPHSAGHGRVPVGLVLVYIGILVWGMYYLVANFRGPSNTAAQANLASSVASQATATPPGVTAAAEAATPAASGSGEEAAGGAAAGKALFVSNGCVGCHGQNGEGGLGPNLAGTQLSFDQVLKQLRTPIGVMPPFPPSQLSDEQAKQIYEYVKGLQ